MSLTLVTAPTGEPITIEEAKAYSHITTADDDGVIDGLITTARQMFDGRDTWFGRALLTQRWGYILPRFPYCSYNDDYAYLAIELPLPPLRSIVSIQYIDVNGATQVMAGADYVVDTNSDPGRVMPAYGTSWPQTRDIFNAVTITFDAGYGAAKDVPGEIKNWLKQAVGYLYLNREAAVLPAPFFWSLAKYKKSWCF